MATFAHAWRSQGSAAGGHRFQVIVRDMPKPQRRDGQNPMASGLPLQLALLIDAADRDGVLYLGVFGCPLEDGLLEQPPMTVEAKVNSCSNFSRNTRARKH